MSPGVQPNVLMLNLVKEHAALASCFQHRRDDQQIYKLLKPQHCCSPYSTLSQDKFDIAGLLLESNRAPSPHLRAGLLQLLVSLVPTWVATIGQPSLPSCSDTSSMPARCPRPSIFSLFLLWCLFWTFGRWVWSKKATERGRTLRFFRRRDLSQVYIWNLSLSGRVTNKLVGLHSTHQPTPHPLHPWWTCALQALCYSH